MSPTVFTAVIIQDKLWKIKRLLLEVNLLNVSPLNSAGEANTEVKAAMMQNKRTQTRVTLIVTMLVVTSVWVSALGSRIQFEHRGLSGFFIL